MVNANRILTVSYGTFSCTLEGFDDPFNTMKSIAEYFRDLAADDRYFGAEPPQPDAAMLHRIAEREVNRRVEARVAADGVVLRQIGSEAAAAPLAPPASIAAAEPAAAPRPAPQVQPAEPSPVAESVAEKLSRIRAAVARARATEDAMAQTFEEDEATEAGYMGSIDEAFSGPAFPEDAELVEDAVAAATPDEDETESILTTAQVLADTTDAAPEAVAEEAEAVAEDAEAVAEDAEAVAEDAEAVAEDAEAIAEDAEAIAEDAEAIAEDAEAIADTSDDDALAALAAELNLDEDDLAEAGAPSDDALWHDFDADDDRAEEDTLAAIAAELNPADADEDTLAQDDDLDGLADVWDELDALADADIQDPAEVAEEDALADLADGWDDEEIEIEAEADDEDVAVSTDDDQPRAAPHARIIRLKRSDFEAALAAGDIEEIEDEDAMEDTIASFARNEREAEALEAEEAARRFHAESVEPAEVLIDEDEEDYDFDDRPAAEAQADTGERGDDLEDDIRSLIGDTSLSDQDEEDLLEELASVERDVQRAQQAERRDAAAAADDAGYDDDAEETGDGDEDALNRLLSETNAKLGENEGSRRRSAIAHLKAAVAATRADRLLKTGRAREEETALNQYRDDLAKVVRPRRPTEAAPDSRSSRGRPVADLLRDRGTPLMLVSEQRVDLDDDAKAAAAAPVRPRRVAARPADVSAPSSTPKSPAKAAPAAAPSFADFAAKAGAQDLPDILEAAAAYATLVEGQEGVSRPQILRRAASLTGDDEVSREKGLQSFGKLLRSGRIRKLGHGRFAVNEEAEVARMARASGE